MKTIIKITAALIIAYVVASIQAGYVATLLAIFNDTVYRLFEYISDQPIKNDANISAGVDLAILICYSLALVFVWALIIINYFARRIHGDVTPDKLVVIVHERSNKKLYNHWLIR